MTNYLISEAIGDIAGSAVMQALAVSSSCGWPATIPSHIAVLAMVPLCVVLLQDG